MNIFIDDLIFSLQKAGGISVYWSELMKRMNKPTADHNFTCISSQPTDNIFWYNINWQQPLVKDSSLPIMAKRFLPLQQKLPANSIFHSSYLRYCNQKNVVNILTLHDLAPELGFIQGSKTHIRKWQQKKALQKADGVICVSETMRTAVLNYYSFLVPEKVTTIYHGVSDNFYELPQDQKTTTNSILFVGDRSYYKNFELAVNILHELADFKLTIVGGKPLSPQEVWLLNNKLKNRFEYTAVITSKQLNILYNNAVCLLYPSSYEGFGLPIIEAMKAGCAVITTQHAAIPEIAGSAAIQVNSLLVNDFVQAIQLLQNKNIKNNLVAAGKIHANNFSWDNCFSQTLQFYATISAKI